LQAVAEVVAVLSPLKTAVVKVAVAVKTVPQVTAQGRQVEQLGLAEALTDKPQV
jgi:hypothetical protein